VSAVRTGSGEDGEIATVAGPKKKKNNGTRRMLKGRINPCRGGSRGRFLRVKGTTSTAPSTAREVKDTGGPSVAGRSGKRHQTIEKGVIKLYQLSLSKTHGWESALKE